MDSIYRRKRIHLPKKVCGKFKNIPPNKTKKLAKFLIIITVMLITFISILKSIEPIVDTICKDKAKSVATIICNEESTKIITNYKYEDIITVHRNNEGKIEMVQSNIVPINYIISDVAEKIQKRIEETRSEWTQINIGSFTGSKLLSGIGPNIPIKLSLVGNVETDLRSEFKSQGVNQTIHRIYLQVDCKINILTPYKITAEKISNQVLIAENIIIGDVPETFYDLEGLTTADAMEVME